MQVARACSIGEQPKDTYDMWQAVKDTFKPNSTPVWLDDYALQATAAWLDTATGGICWVEHVAFGKRLAEITGRSYYGAQGLDKNKNYIEDAKGEPIIASIAANSEGRNLQRYYSKNLISSVPPGNAVWEQLIGRTHRDGQVADEVTVDVLIECYEQWAAMQQSLLDARYAQDTLGQVQKLNIADVTLQSSSSVEELALTGDPLWDKTNADFFRR